MNEISRTADEGAYERCEECGEIVLSEMLFSAMSGKNEVLACLGCHVEHGRVFM